MQGAVVTTTPDEPIIAVDLFGEPTPEPVQEDQ